MPVSVYQEPSGVLHVHINGVGRTAMIQNFFSSWGLFYQSYLTGWLICILLSMIGVLVVARDQIFIGAAMSQASTLGIALTMWAASSFHLEELSWFNADVLFSVMAVVFSVIAASMTARGGQTGRESHEAITGWVFLISGSLSILIVSHSPHGLEEVHRLMSSSIIGATITDVWSFGYSRHLDRRFPHRLLRKILLFALDVSMAVATGMKIGLWNGILVGLVRSCHWTLHKGLGNALHLRMSCSSGPCGKESVPGSPLHVSRLAPGSSRYGSHCVHPGQSL